MPKFMFIYRSQVSTEEPSPEKMQQIMASWMSWIGGARQAGWMTDAGNGLLPVGSVVSPGSTTDGPFIESKEYVGGYSEVVADSLEDALALTAGCPSLAEGGSVEVRQIMDLPEPA